MLISRKVINRSLLFSSYSSIQKKSVYPSSNSMRVVCFLPLIHILALEKGIKNSKGVYSLIQVLEDFFPISLVTHVKAEEAFLYKEYLHTSGPVIFRKDSQNDEKIQRKNHSMGIGVGEYENFVDTVHRNAHSLFPEHTFGILPIVFGDIKIMRRIKSSRVLGVRVDRIANVEAETLASRLLKLAKNEDLNIS